MSHIAAICIHIVLSICGQRVFRHVDHCVYMDGSPCKSHQACTVDYIHYRHQLFFLPMSFCKLLSGMTHLIKRRSRQLSTAHSLLDSKMILSVSSHFPLQIEQPSKTSASLKGNCTNIVYVWDMSDHCLIFEQIRIWCYSWRFLTCIPAWENRIECCYSIAVSQHSTAQECRWIVACLQQSSALR